MILVLAFMFLVDRELSFILWGKFPYPHGLVSLVLRCFWIVGAIVIGNAVLSLITTLPEKYNKIGQNSLFIYLYHTFIISVLIKIINRYGIPQNELTTIVLFFIVWYILVGLMKVRILHLLLCPVSRLVSRYL